MRSLLVGLALLGCAESHGRMADAARVVVDAGSVETDAPSAPVDAPARPDGRTPAGGCETGVVALVREGRLELLSLDRSGGWNRRRRQAVENHPGHSGQESDDANHRSETRHFHRCDSTTRWARKSIKVIPEMK